MSPAFIRHKFIEKFGKEKYEEFVLSLYESFPPKKMLLFWQEKLLERLFKDLDIPTPGIEEIYSIFNHCPIHDAKLNSEIVPIINGNDSGSHLTFSEEKKWFPLANVNAPRDLDRFEYPEKVKILYCSSCRKERISKIK